MKEMKVFYLDHCPYCKHARRALEELTAQRPEYGTVPVCWLEESRVTELDGSYDYYYVPSIFYGTQKLYEAQPGQDYDTIRDCVKGALDTVLAEARSGEA